MKEYQIYQMDYRDIKFFIDHVRIKQWFGIGMTYITSLSRWRWLLGGEKSPSPFNFDAHWL